MEETLRREVQHEFEIRNVAILLPEAPTTLTRGPIPHATTKQDEYQIILSQLGPES
jgi:hypothetical protein